MNEFNTSSINMFTDFFDIPISNIDQVLVGLWVTFIVTCIGLFFKAIKPTLLKNNASYKYLKSYIGQYNGYRHAGPHHAETVEFEFSVVIMKERVFEYTPLLKIIPILKKLPKRKIIARWDPNGIQGHGEFQLKLSGCGTFIIGEIQNRWFRNTKHIGHLIIYKNTYDPLVGLYGNYSFIGSANIPACGNFILVKEGNDVTKYKTAVKFQNTQTTNEALKQLFGPTTQPQKIQI